MQSASVAVLQGYQSHAGVAVLDTSAGHVRCADVVVPPGWAALLLTGNHAILLCLRAGPLALTPSLVLVGYCCPPQPGYVQTLTAVQACRRDLV